MPGFGCANAYNMGQMLARPRDAAIGRPAGPADATVNAAASPAIARARSRALTTGVGARLPVAAAVAAAPGDGARRPEQLRRRHVVPQPQRSAVRRREESPALSAMVFVTDSVALSRVPADLFSLTLGKANIREGTIDTALALSDWPRDLDLLIVDLGGSSIRSPTPPRSRRRCRAAAS